MVVALRFRTRIRKLRHLHWLSPRSVDSIANQNITCVLSYVGPTPLLMQRTAGFQRYKRNDSFLRVRITSSVRWREVRKHTKANSLDSARCQHTCAMSGTIPEITMRYVTRYLSHDTKSLWKKKIKKKIAIVKNNIAIRIAGKVSRYIDASMNRAIPRPYQESPQVSRSYICQLTATNTSHAFSSNQSTFVTCGFLVKSREHRIKYSRYL